MTTPALIPFAGPVELVTLSTKLPALFLADAKASERFWEFFAANIRNRNTRRAYYKAACRFNDLARFKYLHSRVYRVIGNAQLGTKP
jgi:hypothetical protein